VSEKNGSALMARTIGQPTALASAARRRRLFAACREGCTHGPCEGARARRRG